MNFKSFFFIFFIFCFWQLPANANSTFIDYCKYPITRQQHEINWLKFLFKVETCEQIEQKLSTLNSYNEFIPAFRKPREQQIGSWTEAFPELYGITKKYDVEDARRILKADIDFRDFFTDLSPYWKFKNLKLLDFSTHFNKKNICSVLSYQSAVDVISIGWESYKEFEKCKFYYRKVKVIILGDFIGSGKESYVEDIVGIEHFGGGSTRLDAYPGLKFVGINISGDYRRFSSLVLLQNLTHLSITSTDGMKGVSDLSELQNLVHLSLSCVTNALTYDPSKTKIEVCSADKLEELSFLKDIPWLKSLNLSYSGLKDASPLLDLVQLESLDISHNDIQKMPDFSKLPNLKNLNVSENPGTEK